MDSKSNQNNDNNFDGSGTSVFDSNSNNNNNNNVNTNDQTTIPNGNKPDLTTALNEGGKNGLDYDIDIRFGGSNDKKPNRKPLN